MDIRIVNTCNNNCLYCLEQEYRNREAFRAVEDITMEIQNNPQRDMITFYGWNPLLHPKLIDIIWFCKNLWFSSIGILSNTWWLSDSYLRELIDTWLTSFGFYFHTFNQNRHAIIVNSGISYSELIVNIKTLHKSSLSLKAVVHINRLNIDGLYRDVANLYASYGINTFEFINYFPFDRPYEKYHTLLGYNIIEKRKCINALLKVIKKLNLRANFVKFSSIFFPVDDKYYNFQKWILDQIGQEDIIRLSPLQKDPPFCFTEKRCSWCFIRDNCLYYGNQNLENRKDL